MTRLHSVRYRGILALLLLCLNASVWLQGEHIHLEDRSFGTDCFVCHYGAGIALAPDAEFVFPEFVALASSNRFYQSEYAAVAELPPARAPPVEIV